MIQVVSGALGMGKTLYTVMLMFDALCRGQTVVTNIDVVWDELVRLAQRMRGVELDEAQLVRVDPEKNPNWQALIPWGVPDCPVEVYFDEIHLFYNSRDWQKTGTDSRSLLSFLSQSRKAGVNVTFISQEKENMEKQFRMLAEWELAIVSSHHIPLPIFRIFPRCFIVRVKDIQKGHLVKRTWRPYDRKFFRCYQSFSFLDSEMNDLAARVERVARRKLLRVPYYRRLWLDCSEPFYRFSRLHWVRKILRLEVVRG